MAAAEKKCPYCKEMIKAEAIKCRFCGEFLEDPRPSMPAQSNPASAPSTPMQEPVVSAEQIDERQVPAYEKTIDSETIFEGPLSKIDLIGPISKLVLWLLVAAGIGAGAVFIPAKWADKWEYTRISIWGLCAAVAIVGGIIFLVRFLVFKNRRYCITNDRIEYHTGLLAKSVDNIDMWRVKDLQFRQSFFQRLIGVGVVFVESNDSTDPYLLIGPVPNAKKLYERLRKAVLEADRRRGVLHIEQ